MQVAVEQQAAAAVGGRVTAWLARRAGIEASLWYAFSGVSKVGQYSGGSFNEDIAGGIAAAAARAVVNLPAWNGALSVLFMGGPAVIHRSGDHWGDWAGTTSVGGSFGLGLDIHRGHRFGIRAAIEDYVYAIEDYVYEFGGAGTQDLHHDVVLSLSTGYSLPGQHR